MRNGPAIRRVLNLVIRDRHVPENQFVLAVSPPGAGKTTLVEMVATTGCHHGLRVGIACPGLEQAFDLIRRLMAAYPSQRLRLRVGKGSALPGDLRPSARPAGFGAHEFGPPAGVCLEVATISKFPYLPSEEKPYDLLVVDEAYQVTFADFVPLLVRADRFLLIGDPGQLPPLVLIDTEPLEGAQYRMHAPAPVEVLRHAPNSPVIHLSVTHRLPQDSARIIQPALYPTLPFHSSATPAQRRLTTHTPGQSGDIPDQVVDSLVGGASLLVVALPPVAGVRPRIDDEATELMAAVVGRMISRQIGPVGGPPFRPRDIGCVDPHVASGTDLRSKLRLRGIPGRQLIVNTPETWQGLERPLMVVRHPLGGGATSAFELEPGRFCVALTRHQFGCVIVARAGIEQMLQGHQHDSGTRPLGRKDAVWAGLQMHQRLWTDLRQLGRVIQG